MVVRRVVTRDGRSRATINDQPVGVALLRRAGSLLVEVQGQGDQMGLADPAVHAGAARRLRRRRRPLRAGVARGLARAGARRAAALDAARAAIAEAQREEDWLRHAVEELAALAPAEGEEDRLAAERQRLQQGERRAEAIAAALAEIAPRDRRNAGPGRRPARRQPRPAAPVAAGPGRPTTRPVRRWPRWTGPRRRWPRPRRC